MASGSGDLFDTEGMSDLELRDLVRDELSTYDTIDSDSIVVTVARGVVILAGRIGTEEERRIAEHVLTDVIGVTEYENDLVVDPIHRDAEPEAIDEQLVAGGGGGDLGRRPDQENDEAAHLDEDLDARLFGTSDVQAAIERGTPWVPPDSPTPEGVSEGDDD
ncbi:MAG: BON domain-containing protein [Gemmatimonadota bacterium]|nr:BON domain-containing protein [Gemmatimonadota bacterium]